MEFFAKADANWLPDARQGTGKWDQLGAEGTAEKGIKKETPWIRVCLSSKYLFKRILGDSY